MLFLKQITLFYEQFKKPVPNLLLILKQFLLSVSSNYFTSNSSLDKVYYAPCGAGLPGGIEGGVCKDSSVCFKDERTGRFVTFKSTATDVYASGKWSCNTATDVYASGKWTCNTGFSEATCFEILTLAP